MSIDPTTSEQLQAQKAAVRDKKRFVRMTYGGSSCIVEPREVDSMIEGEDPGAYTLRNVWMTQAEYDKLPEFEGW